MKNFFLKLFLIFVGDFFATRFAKKGMEQVTATSQQITQQITQTIKFGIAQAVARCFSIVFFLIGLGFFFRYADYHLRNTLNFTDPEIDSIYFLTFSVIAVVVAFLPRWIYPSRKLEEPVRHSFKKSSSLPVPAT